MLVRLIHGEYLGVQTMKRKLRNPSDRKSSNRAIATFSIFVIIITIITMIVTIIVYIPTADFSEIMLACAILFASILILWIWLQKIFKK